MFVQLTRDHLGRKAGERLDVSPADAQDLLAAGVAVAVPDDPIAPAVSRALEGALERHARGLDAVVHRSLRAYADAQSQSRRLAVPALFGSGSGDPRQSFG